MATTPTSGIGDNVWSDRKEAEEEGNIKAIKIRKRSSSIVSIRTT